MAYLFIIFGVLLRLLPHIPNFTPIAAIALFGGTYLSRRTALFVPLLIMAISDLFLGLHPLMLFTWGSFLLTGIIGLWLKNHKTVPNTLGAAISSSLLFFIVTNFGVWALPNSWYPHTWQGLINCYIMAIPFFKNTLLGDLFYVGVLFGLYELAQVVVKKFTHETVTVRS